MCANERGGGLAAHILDGGIGDVINQINVIYFECEQALAAYALIERSGLLQATHLCIVSRGVPSFVMFGHDVFF